MHELSLMEALLDKALAVMDDAGATRITRLEVSVGALCQIVPEAWEMAFAASIPGTPLEAARMEWHLEPARVSCPACALEYPPEDIIWQCPACAAYGGDAMTGEDIVLVRIEVSGGAVERTT